MVQTAERPQAEAAPTRRRRVLLVGGSLNQATTVFEIARELPEAECVVTPYFADGLVGLAAARGLADFTILGGRPKAMSLAFLRAQGATILERRSMSGRRIAPFFMDPGYAVEIDTLEQLELAEWLLARDAVTLVRREADRRCA
jgi:hypothetical protein